MARTDGTTARFDSLHEMITRAEALKLHVTINVHGVPTEELLEWLQLGLLDSIEKGAGQNPPTGTLDSGEHFAGKAEANCFMEDDVERQRRINREEDARIAEVRAELGLSDDQPEAV